MKVIKYEIADEKRIIKEWAANGYSLIANRKVRGGNFLTFQKSPLDYVVKLADLEQRIEAIEKKIGG